MPAKTTASRPVGTQPAAIPAADASRFSLLRRRHAADDLTAYVLDQLERGSALEEVLDSPGVRTWIGDRAYLRDDVAGDALVREAIRARRRLERRARARISSRGDAGDGALSPPTP